jgi:hypothetical protein
MKTIALLLGLTISSFAQEPAAEPPKLYIEPTTGGPGGLANALMDRCPQLVTVTAVPQTAQYRLEIINTRPERPV